ncbi:cytochrome P450 [Mucor mucedo]|uniref:cytochrome P450 n=1 Tax=Mucor mucedo TaxID=29922 RepID=UPI00221FF949|nr:cytochrome P450 [Mucor mucedo]KAI7880495.1 cytochrome P450 [Mucor mucedo]
MSETICLIVALKGCENTETDGHIIRIGNGANTNTVRSLAVEKLGICVPLADIILETSTGEALTEIDRVRAQQVVYINFPEQIKDNIPGPRGLPMVGNLYEMLPDLAAGWGKQFAIYGPLTTVNILGLKIVGTNDPAIAELFVKESEYFTKKVNAGLKIIKEFAGGGLFTSNSDAEEWKLAHKILMPAFSPRAVKAYQPEMGIIAQETIKVLSEYAPEDKVEILDWCTNLTFETIGRIGFGYSFDLMDRSKPSHPFINAMGYALGNSVARFARPSFMSKMPLESNRNWERSIKLMHSIVDEVVAERKASESAKDPAKDLLGFMLNARDEHNLGLSDENIRDQVVTFLIAGHDTTANTLAWVLYELSRHPDIQAKVLQEISNAGITSDALPTVEQISSLKYLSKVLKETLRMHPPLRGISKYCKKDCIVPGGYRIKGDTSIHVSIINLHMNPNVYKNPTVFDPERFSPEEEQKRSLYSWLPFSTGPRACIGMAFALQEAKTVLSMFLHRFDFKYDGPDVCYDPYQATTKPLNMLMNIHPRTNFPEPSEDVVIQTESSTGAINIPEINQGIPTLGSIELPKITFLFGTQTGSAQDYANQLAAQAKRFGFKDITFSSMDHWNTIQTGTYKKLGTDRKKNELVVICTATYNGQPPDSAENFNKFLDLNLQAGNESLLEGMEFAVFGLGNKNWRTYQAFPLKVDASLEILGANRLFSPGSGDADNDMDGDFNQWCAYFWTHVLGKFGVAASLSKSVVPTATLSAEDSDLNAVKINYISPSDTTKWMEAKENKNGVYNSTLIVNRELQQNGSDRSTRHIEIDISQLDSVSSVKDQLYDAGDHIEIMPENNIEEVERIALGFGLVLDSVFEIDNASADSFSPRSMAAVIKGPCTVRNALMYYADFMSPPSRRLLSFFAAQLHASAPETAKKFDSLTMPDENNQDQYPSFIKKHRTLLDLQLAFPQVNYLDLGQFLAAVSVMQPRRYSIASSPLVFPKHAHISVSVVDDIVGDKHYAGLASSYLKRLQGDKMSSICASLKSSKSTFSMPQDVTKPLIMIAAGTGIAPFRGFLQERAFQKKNGQNVGPCTLFFGCRNPEKDFIYSDELEEYFKSGVLVSKHVAFSRMNPPASQKYVQHALLANAGEVWSLLLNEGAENSGSIYVCGSGAMSRDVYSTFQVLARSFGAAQNDKEAGEFLQKLVDEKDFLQDVWG